MSGGNSLIELPLFFFFEGQREWVLEAIKVGNKEWLSYVHRNSISSHDCTVSHTGDLKTMSIFYYETKVHPTLKLKVSLGDTASKLETSFACPGATPLVCLSDGL